MTPFDRFIESLTNLSLNPWGVVKVFYLVALFIFIAFGVIVVRQVKLMSKTLNGILDLPLKLVSCLYLGLTIFVFVLALIIL